MEGDMKNMRKRKGWVYLETVNDGETGEIVGWAMDEKTRRR